MIYFTAFKLQQLVRAERAGRIVLPPFYTPKDIDRMYKRLGGTL